MSATYFVETLNRNKEVRRRQAVDQLPIRIGRGYDNDVILDDPHAAAHHAAVEEGADGGLLVRDLGSRNEIFHGGTRRKKLAIDGQTIFRLGQTSLRVRCADFAVDDEVADGAFYAWEGWAPAMTGAALIVCLTVLNTWVGDTKKFELIRYLIAAVTALGLGMVWCGFWSFANRLFGGSARLGRHLFILGCGFTAMQCWGLVSGAVAYALSWELFTRYGSHVVIAILSAMVFYHLLHIKPDRARLLTVSAVAMALLGSGMMLMTNYNSNGRLRDQLFMHEHYPPAMRLSADKPLGHLLRDAATLKANVDEERTKSVDGDESGGNDSE